jgi:hypothetical protein
MPFAPGQFAEQRPLQPVIGAIFLRLPGQRRLESAAVRVAVERRDDQFIERPLGEAECCVVARPRCST